MYPDMSPPQPPQEPSPDRVVAQPPPRFEREPQSEPLGPEPPRFEPQLRPPFVPRPVDPVAAIVGNATALGLGYMLMGRVRLALAAIAGTAFLLLPLAADPGNLAWRYGFGAWWVLMCFHAWHLTRRTEAALLEGRRKRMRLIATGAAGFVLLAVVGFHLDAWRTVRGAEADHAEGDCASAVETLEGLDAVDRITNGPIIIEGEEQLEACRLLNRARAEGLLTGASTMEDYLAHPAALWDGAGPERAAMLFDVARGGDPAEPLEAGFAQLTDTLAADPGQSDRVRGTVEQLMADLDADTAPCEAVAVDDWIAGKTWNAPEITEPIAAAADAVPLRLLGCARSQAAHEKLLDAQAAYQRFLAEYPDHAEAATASDEAYEVDSRIEFDNVSTLLAADEYCQAPAPWRGAPAYSGSGPHPMWMIGLDGSAYGMSDSWLSDSFEETEIVTCVDGPKQGRHLDTCYYENPISEYFPSQVDFYATRFDVKVFELRTGEQVDSYTVQFEGDPCPEVLEYTSISGIDFAPPPSEVDAEVSDAQVRSVFERLQD